MEMIISCSPKVTAELFVNDNNFLMLLDTFEHKHQFVELLFVVSVTSAFSTDAAQNL